jgi:hypothetical protein
VVQDQPLQQVVASDGQQGHRPACDLQPTRLRRQPRDGRTVAGVGSN